MAIKVLGTEFNVSAYAEDSIIRTTLVRGSVKISSEVSGESVVLHPGEQVGSQPGDHSMLVSEVDVSYAMAWKEGRLRFKEKPLKEVMKIISRWYDVDVFYMNQQVKDYHFSAWFKRSSSINEVINILEKTKKISLDLKGRILTVKDISRN